MLERIWQIAIHTPVWVYLLLIYLIIVGIKASKTRVTKLQRIFTIPTILAVMSVNTLMVTITVVDYLIVSSWIIAILIGILLGWWQVKRLGIRVDKKRLLIQIPGTWSTMYIIIAIFVTKYYFGYEQATDPIFAEQLGLKVSMLAVSGVCTGLFIGRLIGYLYHFKNSTEVY
ncbi:membrane-associated HD superfamily phosphohydrolase [Sporomusaceae bacterium BoRhaA]|uniref:DUF6622 family protein n=1 Tax=Pelorhabdus rhamnosifermentans TaxID=2772457 RepID=UPI001C060ECA|nr:DUF6622 family protein [Pelorhabdus rhamnosifermentans]MBU2701302.1 membrane-associated HD superfamily phosphohydrolase [Pelorhabdus rhamnosifermentans]